MTDMRIKAIREDKLVGRGSCSSIDECMSDAELIKIFDEHDIKTVKAALKFAYDHEELWLERGLNQRWGDDDDPQLINYDNFKKQRHDNEE